MLKKKFAHPCRKRDRFFNPVCAAPSEICRERHEEVESIIWHTIPLALRIFLSRLRLPSHSVSDWFAHEMPRERSHACSITWIGHATFLIQWGGINILTDPVLGNIFPVFRRMLPAGIAKHMLPPIDYVLISHNHRDHMDAASLDYIKQCNPRVNVLVPHGDKNWFDARGFLHVREYAWWQSVRAGDMTLTFLPAVHWAQRGIFDKNKSLWGSWLIEHGGRSVYFAGDTAYDSHFKEIADEYMIDIALMPIGPCEPHDFMRKTHVDARQAVQAFHDLRAHSFIPMHWGTFGFGLDRFDEPITRLHDAWHVHAEYSQQHTVHIVKAGQRIEPDFELSDTMQTPHYKQQNI